MLGPVITGGEVVFVKFQANHNVGLCAKVPSGNQGVKVVKANNMPWLLGLTNQTCKLVCTTAIPTAAHLPATC